MEGTKQAERNFSNSNETKKTFMNVHSSSINSLYKIKCQQIQQAAACSSPDSSSFYVDIAHDLVQLSYTLFLKDRSSSEHVV